MCSAAEVNSAAMNPATYTVGALQNVTQQSGIHCVPKKTSTFLFFK